ncbi:ligand-gated ion channel [Arenibaculum pallidiluteum]|uniref:hypothetical protein n=1 Tax=Arenibaculum pallidiluteum TaxID=2812559 RepID=UPI001A9638E6|nr:hypothetical protein [Arenibaculum pallidiluteum]
MTKLLRILAFLLSALVPVAAAAPQAAAQPAAQPEVVTIGTYVHQLDGMSLRDGKIGVDFYVWTRWRSRDIDPMEGLEIMNGQIEEKQIQDVKDIGEERYALARIRAQIKENWDVFRFPLDRQEFGIALEHTTLDSRRLVFVPDARNIELAPDLEVPGYDIGHASARVGDVTYRTNYGDTSLPSGNESTYSRYVHSIELVRPGLGYFFKLFSSIFISTLVAFLAFLVKPTDLDPRFGLGVGAVFAVVACAFVISSQLPDTAEFALADRINLVSMGLIFFSIIQSAISLTLYETAPAASRRFDLACLVLFPVVYAFAIMSMAVGTGLDFA